MNKKEPGTLAKEYTRNPDVAGPQCDGAGNASDIIGTAIRLGTFGLSANDPQLYRWYTGPSALCGGAAATTTPVDGVQVTLPDGNPTPSPDVIEPVGFTIPPVISN